MKRSLTPLMLAGALLAFESVSIYIPNVYTASVVNVFLFVFFLVPFFFIGFHSNAENQPGSNC